MFLILILSLTFFLKTVSITNYTEELQILKENINCDSCCFNYTEVTNENIGSWPKNCSDVYAILRFTPSSNKIPIEKLTNAFKKLSYLVGSLILENTTFESLPFLDNLEFISSPKLGISIINNNKLFNVKCLYSVTFYQPDIPFVLVNNSKLDASLLCENANYESFSRMHVYGNLKDCGCIGRPVNSTNSEYYNDCRAVFGTIEVSNFTDVSKSSAFAKIQNITGNLTIQDTSFQNLSFLGSLRKIKANNDEKPTLVIQNNPNMTRLGLDTLTVLKEISGWFTVNIQNVHPDFCLTMEEMQRFTKINTKFVNIEARFCNVTSRKDGEKVCIFDKMSTLETACVHIMGHVSIQSGEEEFINRLKTVNYIYGSLTIRNTNLTDLKFLDNLINVALLNESSPPIKIIENDKLSNIRLASMAFPFSTSKYRLSIKDNAPGIFVNSMSCFDYQNEVLGLVLYNGGSCINIGDSSSSDYYTEGEDNSSDKKKYTFITIFLGILTVQFSSKWATKQSS